MTSLVAIPIVLLAVASSTPSMVILILLACFLCLAEAAELFEIEDVGLLDALPVLAAALLSGILNSPVDSGGTLPSRDYSTPAVLVGAWGLWIAGLLAAWRMARGRRSLVERVLAPGWFTVPLLSLMFLHPFEWNVNWAWTWSSILIILIPVWAGDIAAMLAGKAFGRHLLAPSISPKKTWEGALANLIASMAGGFLTGLLLGYPALIGLACGIAVGACGQLGDLFESALKRAAGKKDSGNLLPGHGGILDRIDSLVASVLPVWLILWLGGVL